jgi:hypothetical protein
MSGEKFLEACIGIGTNFISKHLPNLDALHINFIHAQVYEFNYKDKLWGCDEISDVGISFGTNF